MRSAKARGLLVLIALFGAGCNSPVASNPASPAPGGVPFAQSPEPSSQPTAAPSPRPIPKVLTGYTFPVALKLDCRIPVRLNRATDEKTPPGFLDLTTGHFTSDPSSRVVEVQGSWDDWRTVATPVLRGFNGITYSWSAGRWLPAYRWQVSPDGLHYAYPEVITPNRSMKLHVVDLVSGTDRVVSTVPSFVVLDYRSDGLYVVKAGYYAGDLSAGLWQINPTTGVVLQLLSDSATSVSLDGAAAWGSERAILPTVLYRYDLKTGTRAVWFAKPNTQVIYRATDSAGRPLVLTTTWPATDPTATTLHLMLLSSPSKAKLLYSDPWNDVSLGSFPPVRDSHGIWLGSTAGLWLLQPNGTLVKVTAAPVYPLGDCR